MKKESAIQLYSLNEKKTPVFTRVDTKLLNKLLLFAKRRRWYISKNGYAFGYSVETGKVVWLHRVVMKLRGYDLKPGLQVDHIDRDRLNNVESNLRLATPSQNSLNRRIKSEVDPKTGYIGIKTKRQAVKEGRVIRIVDVHSVGDKVFNSPIEAAKEADRQKRLSAGVFGVQNFPVKAKPSKRKKRR